MPEIQHWTLPARGINLALTLYKPDPEKEKDKTLFLCVPGFTRDHNYMRYLSEGIADRGHFAATIDPRGHGKSTGEYEVDKTALDVLHTAEYLKSRGANRIVAVGYSAGAHENLMAMAMEKPLKDLHEKGYDRGTILSLPNVDIETLMAMSEIAEPTGEPLGKYEHIIDAGYCTQTPIDLSDYESMTYPIAKLINPITVMAMNKYADIFNIKNGNLHVRKEGNEWWVNEAHTSNPYRFRMNSHGKGPLTNYLHLVNGNPIRMACSPFDMHVLPRDTKKLYEGLKAQGANVEMGYVFFTDTTLKPWQFKMIAKDAVEFAEDTANGVKRSELRIPFLRKIHQKLEGVGKKRTEKYAERAGKALLTAA